MILLDDGSSQRWTSQQSQARHAEYHTHPYTSLLEIFRQASHHRCEESLHASSEPAVDYSPGRQRIMGVDRCPAVKQDAGDEGTWDNVVERPTPAIGHVSRNQTAEETHTIDDNNQIERVRLIETNDVPAKRADLSAVSRLIFSCKQEKHT